MKTNTINEKATNSPISRHSSSPSILRVVMGCVLVPALLTLNSCREEVTGSSQESGDTVDLRALPALGLKWTDKSTLNILFLEGVVGGGRYTTTTKADVIALSNDTITIKSNEETSQYWWGDAFENPDSDTAKTRLIIRTVDRCGRVIASEGESGDDGTQSPLPNHPIKLGDSFTTKCEGSGAGSGENFIVRYTLSEVITVKGRRMAVLQTKYSGDCNGTGSEWRDLHTGLIVKSSANVTSINPQGFRVSLKIENKMTDVNGEKWLD